MSKPTRVIARERVKPGIWKRIGADGKPVYEVTYRDSDGRQRRETVHGGIRAAERRLADLKSDMGKGKRVAPMPKLTFEQAAERWMQSASVQLRPSTRDAYRSALDTHLLPAWGRLRLDRINVDMVASFVERMQTVEYRRAVNARTGKNPNVNEGYKPWSIHRALVVAGSVFEFARRRLGVAASNPVRELNRNERPRHERRERRILSRDELTAVVGAAEPPYSTAIAIAALLGTRLGETLGLRWRDVNLDAGTAAIRVQADRKTGKLVELKTAHSRRVVEMPGALVSVLRAHKLASAYSKPDDLVLASRTGGTLEHRNVAQRGLYRACKAAAIPERWPTFHELRHAHASALIAAGTDLVEVSARLGHGDPSITASTYSHEFEAAGRTVERRARLDAIYGADNGGADMRPAQSAARLALIEQPRRAAAVRFDQEQ